MLILTKMQVVFDQLPYKISRTCDQSLGEEPFRSQPELSGIMQYFKMDFRIYCCQVCDAIQGSPFREHEQSPLKLGH